MEMKWSVSMVDAKKKKLLFNVISSCRFSFTIFPEKKKSVIFISTGTNCVIILDNKMK